MTEHRLNPALRHAVETSSRRASLATLVGTVFAVTTPGWPRVEAKKKDKTARKRKRKNNRKTNDDADGQCQDQLSPCRDFVDDFCALFNPRGRPETTASHRPSCAASPSRNATERDSSNACSNASRASDD